MHESTEGNLAIIFMSKELANQKPQYNENLRRLTVKWKYITTSTELTGMRIFINFSLVAILIRLSGDVETNPGPFNFEVKECRTQGLNVCHLDIRSFARSRLQYHQKQAHKTNSEYHWQHFRQLRNHVDNQNKLAKSKYFQDSVNTNKDKPSEL